MTASPRSGGARAFFADMLQLEGFESLVKDPAIYPKFNQAVADPRKEQTLDDDRLLVPRSATIATSSPPTRPSSIATWRRSTRCRTLSDSEWAPYTFPERRSAPAS